MPGPSLEDVYYLFDPKTTFGTEFFRKYYVEIEHSESNIDELKTRLELSLKTREPIKILFTGHRGSGKTTALHRLISKLGGEFFIVHYSAFDIMDINDISYTDVLLSMLSKMLDKIDGEGLTLNEALSKRIMTWGSSIEKIEVDEETESGGIAAKISIPFLTLMGKIKTETSSRTEIRSRIEPKVSELINIINDVIAEIEKTTGKQVLIVIDNLEKTDPSKAIEIFYNHGTQLVQPLGKIIYTFPIALKNSEKFSQIVINFDKVCMHPNIKILDKAQNPYSNGVKVLEEVISRRAPLDLIEKDALEYIINMSGGVVRELIRIIRDSSIRAITKGKKKIDKEIAITVVNDMKNLYRGQISEDDYRILGEIYKSKELKRDEGLVRLLHNLSVLEYRNDTDWCDVNPIVKSLLSEKGLIRS
ncbi:P-loop NTPase fold protein [Candidatus Methanoperedens nitratireducens]|uniref:Putative Signal recognition particle GTPase n=1 Tax=Candidatus Methanoperedens nitratireducens TaxID=1392998 RepID=A0A284VRK4_9EURY|nr:P-loop NTPase fold protein [Candidatus Methanoperedens nitroreducens]SNQ61915.1 putative Signal recognition particle GTPase [Candidatus Methanoperedens nitroreducens]